MHHYTNSDHGWDKIVDKKGMGKKIQILCPTAMNYICNMGTVDLRDKLQEYYGDRTCSKKLYKFANFLLNMCSMKKSKPYIMASELLCTVHKDR